jgi:hypothetical protein
MTAKPPESGPPPLPEEGRPKKQKPNPLKIIENVIRDYPDTAQDLDLVRAAFLKVQRKAQERTRVLAAQAHHYKKGRDAAEARLDALLRAVADGAVFLPAPARAPSPEPLRLAFTELKVKDYPALARALHARARRFTVTDWQRFLGREVLLETTCLAAEKFVVHGAAWVTADEAEARLQLRQAVARSAERRLRRRSGLKALGALEGPFNLLVERSARFALDLLTAAGRLLAPHVGAPFDPRRHEALAGRPNEGALVVRALMFPGFAVGPGEAVEKAVVYTDRAAGK